MSKSTVTIEFSPPRDYRSVKESWLITAEGEPDLFLPRSKTMMSSPDGDLVHSVTVPGYVASDPERNWGSAMVPGEDILPQVDSPSMSRYDWFMLGITMAMIIRGEGLRNVVWEAEKIVGKLKGENDGHRTERRPQQGGD